MVVAIHVYVNSKRFLPKTPFLGINGAMQKNFGILVVVLVVLLTEALPL